MKAFGIVIVILAAVLAVMGVFGSITDIANRTLTFYSVAIESILSVVTGALIVVVVLRGMQDSRFGQLVGAVVAFSFLANLILVIGFATGSVDPMFIVIAETGHQARDAAAELMAGEQGNAELSWFVPLIPAVVQGLFLVHYLRS